MTLRKLIVTTLFVQATFLAGSCFAEKPIVDTRAPINISADRASYEKGTGVYEGRVELTQGGVSISADRLIIEQQNREVDRVIALGKPAHMSQAEDDIQAEANSIEYFVVSGKVILTENAVIQQQGSEIRGTRIVYDSLQQIVNAEGEQGDNPQRVNMTLQPKQWEKDPDNDTNKDVEGGDKGN